MNEYIHLTLDNLENEHLCCAISDKKHQAGVDSKREWLQKRIPEGHVFRKLNAQGKVFIEYAPVETAWVPVVGENYMHIYCLWVAGSFKGNGYGQELLRYAIEDSKQKGKSGLCVIVAKKKKPYLSEKKFFEKFGFKVVDAVGDYELMVLSFDDQPAPRFTETARKMEIDNKCLTIYYGPQCPFVRNCIREAEEYQKEKQVEIELIPVDSLEEAKAVPCVFHNWATFQNGKFVSNQLLNKNLIDKLFM